MSAERIDVLAVMDAEIARCSHLPTAADLYVIERYHAMVDARAAVAELIERERQQREVLELLCQAYIANRHAADAHGFVRCVTPGGNRLADTETGRLWLRADALARVQGEPRGH